MEKIVVGKWYRHRGNKNSVPKRVKNASNKYRIIARYRDGVICDLRLLIMDTYRWEHLNNGCDIMAYQFATEKK